MTPDQWLSLVTQGGAVAVLLGVIVAAIRGEIRFRPGVDAEVAALKDALADARTQRDNLVVAVDKLGDALEARNRRDERTARRNEP